MGRASTCSTQYQVEVSGSKIVWSRICASRVSFSSFERPLPLHPLCGGIPPEVAWHHLELAAAATARAQSE